MLDLVIDFNDPSSKAKLWECLKTLTGEQVFKIKKKTKVRTVQEHRYYWVVIAYISDFTGDDPAYLHEVYKYRHIPAVKFMNEYRLTTTDMTHDEIWDYIDLVKMDAFLTLGIRIPEPNEVIY